MRLSKRWFLCCTVLFVLAASPTAHGDAVFGEVFPYRQPDGTLIEVRVWGDEFYRVVESLDGYTLVGDPTTGAACYARLSPNGRELMSTGVPVGSALRAGLNLTQHIRISRASARAKIAAARARFVAGEAGVVAALPAPPQLAPPNNGDVQGIVLLVDFVVDEPWSIPASDIDDYCNLPGYTGYDNNGSVRDYFYDVSDGDLTYTNFVPTAYYRAQHPRSYYEDPEIPFGTRARELMIEALTDLDNQGFDFSQYDSNYDGLVDGVNCFYAGTRKPFWAVGLWPHSWSVSFQADGVSTYRYQMTDIGDSLRLRTFCHENGHMICYWPDLYDYGYESAGVGNFCLMCSGASNTNPAEPSAYLKYIAGWSTTTILSTKQAGLSVPSGVNTLYKYEHPTLSNEYFLVENRQLTGRDAAIPDAGLAIWHIDTLGSNNNEQMTPDMHYRVTLMQADGEWDLEYDNNRGDSEDLWDAASYPQVTPYTYPNTSWWDGSVSDLTVTNISASGATMTFDFNTLADCNINTVADSQDVSAGTSLDCNTNVVPDECDLAVRFSSSSGDLSPIGNGSAQSYTLVSPPAALRHVTLRFEAAGDFEIPDEHIDVDVNGTSVGSVFEVGGYGCLPLTDRDGIVVPPDTFNAAVAGGNAVINMVATGDVDPLECDSYVRVTVEYEAVGASCNQNGIPDECDIGSEFSDDCNSNDVPDECDTTGGGVLLEEDFGGGLPAGWTVLGMFQTTGQCAAATAGCAQTLWAYAGSTTTCTYGDEEWGELIVPPVTLGYGLSNLSFCSRLNSEWAYDFASVWVNDTRVWQESGGSGQWEDRTVDLGEFAGQTMTITFRFASDAYVSGALGWQVDSVTVTSGVADENHNGIPDECEEPADCNNNGIEDSEDIAAGTSEDCNTNGIPDECDIRDGTSFDINGNEVPDECECSPSSPPQGEMMIDEDEILVVSKKNRFLSFGVGDQRENQIIRVKFIDLAPPYDQFNDNHMWVGEPFKVTESPAQTAPGQPGFADFWAAKLQCDKPAPMDFNTLTGDCLNGVCWHSKNAGQACMDDTDCVRAILHVYGEFVIPESEYEIRVLDSRCDQAEIDNPAIAPPLVTDEGPWLAASLWGDVCGPFVNGQWSAADGECLVPNDVMAVLSKVANSPIAPSKTRADVIGPENPKNMQPDLEVTLTGDVMRVLSACAARPFPADAPPWPCP